MDILFSIIKALHLVSMATWFGAKLLLPGDIRGSLAAGPEAAKLMVPRIDKGAKIGMMAGVATLVTGFGLVFLVGGFGAVSPRIHAGILLALLIFAVGAIIGRPAWMKTKAAIEAGKLDDASRASKRVAMSFGIEHLLWTVTLLAMVFKL